MRKSYKGNLFSFILFLSIFSPPLVGEEHQEEYQEEYYDVYRMDFPVGEYEQLPLSGSGIIEGHVSCGGNANNRRMYLNPITSYSEEWYDEAFTKGYTLSPADKRLFAYLRFSVSSESGAFSFYGVPPGDFYLTVLCDPSNTQQSILVGILQVEDAHTTKIDLEADSSSLLENTFDGDTFSSDERRDPNRGHSQRTSPRYPSDD